MSEENFAFLRAALSFAGGVACLSAAIAVAPNSAFGRSLAVVYSYSMLPAAHAPDPKEVAALHEAAHAVVAVDLGLTVSRCTVTPNAHHYAHVELEDLYEPPATRKAPTDAEVDRLTRFARQAYAGHVAEQKRYGREHVTGCADDIAAINVFAGDLYSDELARQEWRGQALVKAKRDVERLWPAIEALADEIMVFGDRTHADVVAAIERCPHARGAEAD